MKQLTKAMLSVTTFAAFLGTTISPVRAADVAFEKWVPSAYSPSVNTGTARTFASPNTGGANITETFSGWSEGAAASSPSTAAKDDTAIGSGWPTGFYIDGTVAALATPFPFHAGPQSTGPSGDSDASYGFWDFTTTTVSPTFFGVGMTEQGGDDFKDARLDLKFSNNNTAAIQGVNISYDVTQWREGKRQNEIRLRYNNANSFGSAPDLIISSAILNTGNNGSGPINPLTAVTTLKNSAAGTVIFPNQIANSGVGFFRWGYGTAGTGNTSGKRDTLAVGNIVITPIFAGAEQTFNAGTGIWENGQNFDTTKSPTTWQNDNGVDLTTAIDGAIFPTGLSTMSIVGTVHSTDVQVQGTSGTLAFTDGGSASLVNDGPINVTSGRTASIATALSGKYGVIKAGPGNLVISGAVTSPVGIQAAQGNITFVTGASTGVDTGVLTIGSTDPGTGPVGSIVTVSNGLSLTFGGVQGSKESTLALGSSGITTLDAADGASLNEKGDITGTSGTTLVKIGTGTEKFNTIPKTYAGNLEVDDGTLELGNDTMVSGVALASVNSIVVNGTANTLTPPADDSTTGVLSLVDVGDGVSLTTFDFAKTIELAGGTLDVQDDLTLKTNAGHAPITLDTEVAGTHNKISVSGSGTTFAIAGKITGSGGFRKTGAGQVTLSNTSDDYAGITDLNNGDLVVPAAGVLGSSPILHVTGSDPSQEKHAIFNADFTVNELDVNSADPDPITMILPPQIAFLDLGAHTFTVNQVGAIEQDPNFPLDPSRQEDITTNFQGDLTGTGTFKKDGTGYIRFTRYDKTYAGAVEIVNGVLEASNNVTFPSVTTFTVDNGGQLRFASRGNPTGTLQHFKITNGIVLKSVGRATDGIIQNGLNLGIEGGIRYQTGQGAEQADLTGNINVAAASDIHVDGVDKIFTLLGVISGSSSLNEAGGGKLILAGNSGSYAGNVTLANGATTLKLATGAFFGSTGSHTVTVGTSAQLGAESANLGNIRATTVEVQSGGYLSQGEQFSYPGGDTTQQATVTGVYNQVGPLKVTGNLVVDSGATLIPADGSGNLSLVTVAGNATFASGSIIDLQGVTIPTGSHNILTVSGMGHSIMGSLPTVVNGTGVTVSVSGGSLVLTR